jgi:DNA-binding LytR/AlgR family response regulator
MILKCLIVDDEPLAHKVLESYISKLDSLKVEHNCYSAIEAINYLHNNKVDIIFLDINMPDLTGMQMLKTLQNPPIVVMTTAYSEYALEGYEFGVFDYLMKPIRFDRFLKTIQRIMDQKKLFKPAEEHAGSPENENLQTHIFVKADGIQHKVNFSELKYIESKGNFVQLNQANKLLTAETLSSMDKKLAPHGFLRVHKSFIVNISKVKGIQGKQLLLEDAKIPIGNSYRQIVLSKIGL